MDGRAVLTMSRKPGAKAINVREAIITSLRDADWPLATEQVIALVADPAHHREVYPNLRALERSGVVERADVPSSFRAVYWRLRRTQQHEEFNTAFEALAAELEEATKR